MILKKIILGLLIILPVLSIHSINVYAVNTYETQIEQQVDKAFVQIQEKLANRSVENQIELYTKIISRVESIEATRTNLNEESRYLLRYISEVSSEIIQELKNADVNITDVFGDLLEENATPVESFTGVNPEITPGYINAEDRGVSEIGEFTISGATVTLSELELKVIGDGIFSIRKGKVYIVDDTLRKVAENTGHSYYNNAATLTFKNQDIKLIPRKYTIWVENIEVLKDTHIEVEINDMEVAEEKGGDYFEDKYIGTSISKTKILSIDTTTETPSIISGEIDAEERGINELGAFTISGGNVNFRELELKIIGDEVFSIREGKVYILDSQGKAVGESSGYRYSSKVANVYFKSEKITLIPGKYTILAEEVVVEENTNIEIQIEDLKAVEDGLEEKYRGTTISETEILYIK